MNEIQFNCPQCGQHLAVDATTAGGTVACPKCGQPITVPQLARVASVPTPIAVPARTQWGWIAAGIVAVALLVGGALIWQIHRSSARPTLEALSGKQFRFSTTSARGRWHQGFIELAGDGKISGSGVHNPNESFWTIDKRGQLIFKHRDGRISTIFSSALRQDGKWSFSGPFQFGRGITNWLEQVSPETVANEKWINPLEVALCNFQNNHDSDTANFVSNILASVEKPGGTAPDALSREMERMKNRVRELVGRGDMKNAAALDHAQMMTFYSYNFPNQPSHPNHKAGGAPAPGGLVLYFPFDHPDTKGVVHDESGAGNDGHVFGAQWVPNGKFGGAYCFSICDFDDRIVVPNGDSLNAENLTVAAWIKAPASAGFYERILDKDFYHGFALSLSGDWQGQADRGKLLWETGNGIVTGRRADDNQWHHVAAVYDGQMVRCYVDGVETSHRARKTGPMSQSGWDLCIGNSVVNYGWGELMAFDGLIDEVRIYNRALSAEEIRSLATATHAGADITGVAPQAAAAANKIALQPEDAFEQNRRLGRGVGVRLDGDWNMNEDAKYFRMIKDAGFNSVRIILYPFGAMDAANGWKLNPSWLAALDEEIRDGQEEGLAVILDCHESNGANPTDVRII